MNMAGKKILLVDDEADFVELMKTRLEANDYDVITSNNGVDALEQLKKAKPDAVLLDIMMPEMDGLVVLKTIRAEHKRLPIFIITAFSNEERVKTAANLDATGFIIKTQDLGKEIKNITAAIQIAEKFKE